MYVSSLKKFLVAMLLGMASTGFNTSFAAAVQQTKQQSLRGGTSATEEGSIILHDTDHDGVAADHEASVDQPDSRALGTSYYAYPGACRYNGKDKYHKKYKGSLYTYSWCETECSTDHQCNAFEYYYKQTSHGFDQHCEIWRYTPNGYKHDNKFKCRVKTTAPPTVNYDYTTKHGACRKSKTSDGEINTDYKRYKWDYHKCASECWEDSSCKAFEHDKNQHCEIWYVKPTYFKGVGNLKCYLK